MTRLLSLAYLTYAPLEPPAAIRLAAALGYDGVGLRILPGAPGGAYDALIEQDALRRETLAALRETGVAVMDVEIIRLGADFRVERVEPFLDVCHELGARSVLVAGDDTEPARLAASFASFCAAAATRGIAADLEFMPWTAVRDCRAALAVVLAAGQPNGGVLPDALHIARSATTLDDLRALPRERLHYGQVCDASVGGPWSEAELIRVAREDRLHPGEGGIDLGAILAALPGDLPLSVEVPGERGKAAAGVEEWARTALLRTRSLLGGV